MIDPIGAIPFVAGKRDWPSDRIAATVLQVAVGIGQQVAKRLRLMRLSRVQAEVQRMAVSVAQNVNFRRKNPRESGLTHDLAVRRRRFFSRTGGRSRGTNYGSIDAPQLVVDFSGIDKHRLQSLENGVPSSVTAPTVKPLPSGFWDIHKPLANRAMARGVRKIQQIASTSIRRSAGGRPVGAGGGNKSAITSHCRSVSRCLGIGLPP